MRIELDVLKYELNPSTTELSFVFIMISLAIFNIVTLKVVSHTYIQVSVIIEFFFK